jgi:hypothetical protein
LDVASKEIERVHDVLQSYPHVRYFSINENKLKSLEGLSDMHSLLYLDANQNLLKNAEFLSVSNRLSYLQEANLSQNKIKELEKVVLPRLRRLNLDENKLKGVEAFGGHRQLEVLKLNKNKIKSLAGLENMPRLRELHLGENKIKTWEGLSGLPSLELLDLRLNLLKEIPESLPALPRLREVNLSGNRLARLGEIARLQPLGALQVLSVEGNPMEEEAGGDLRRAVLVAFCVRQTPAVIEYHRLLAKVNDQEFADDERAALLEDLVNAAEDERRRKEEEERERKEREEEERRLKEEEDERERLRLEEERLAKEEEDRRVKEEEERLRQEAAMAPPTDDPAQQPDTLDPQDGAEEQMGGDGDQDD